LSNLRSPLMRSWPPSTRTIHAFAAHAGQLGLDQISLRVFADVHRRRPVGSRHQFLTGATGSLAQPRVLIEELFELTKRVPTCKRHDGPPDSLAMRPRRPLVRVKSGLQGCIDLNQGDI